MDAADLAFAGLAEHARLLAAGEVSSRELTDLFLERIQRLDPLLNAYRVVFHERARAEADQADARRRAGERRPLLGIPLAIKDDVDVAGEVTAMGTDAEERPAVADAEVVRRLRSAGAVILGKTNVPELTITPWTESPTYGVTRNPWDLHRTAGGSSGGTAAAVAAGLASAGLGSDGAGSIRIPAACCGLVGIKPQRGHVPTAPLVEPWQGMAIWGPLARRTADWALMMDAIRDGGPPLAGAAAAADAGRRLRIATSVELPRAGGIQPDAEQRGAVASTAEVLRGLGHEVVEREVEWGDTLVFRVLARYMRGIHDESKRLAHPERLSRRTRGYIRLGAAIPPALVQRAIAAAEADAARLNRAFDEGFDAIVTPMFSRRPLRVGEYEGRGALVSLVGSVRFVPFCGPFNHTGQPAGAIPAGFTPDGFPLSVQVIAPPDGEAVVVSLAAQLEQARDWPAQRPPVAA